MAIQVGELKIGETFHVLGYSGTVVAKGNRTTSVLLVDGDFRTVERLDRKEVVYCELN